MNTLNKDKVVQLLNGVLSHYSDLTTGDPAIVQMINIAFGDNFWKVTDEDNLQFYFESSEESGKFTFKFREFNRCDYPNLFDEFMAGELEWTTDNLYDGTFMQSEIWNDDSYWIEETIDMNEYSNCEVDEEVKAYYGSMKNLINQNKESSLFIMAECIFENQTGLYGRC